jgi:beta-glucosidase
LYVGLPNAAVFRPEKELKGFKKVFLKKGESKKVEILFDDKTFRYFNVKTNSWEVEEGDYEIKIGGSSADIRLTATCHRQGTTPLLPYSREKTESYYTGKVTNVSDAEFKELLGSEIPDGKWSGELSVNDAFCQMYYAKSGLARFAYKRLIAMRKRADESGKPDLNTLFIYNMPFRAVAKMTGGVVDMDMVRGIVKIVNGHFFSGISGVIGGYFRNRRLNREYEKKLKA